jgi:RIO kinase 1
VEYPKLSTNRYSDDDYDRFESRFNPLNNDRKARRARKPRANPHEHKAPVNPDEVIDHLADKGEGLEGGFQTTYKPGRFEEGWLLESIRPFYDQGLITDVLSLVKGGKEASVYCCAADPETGYEIVAAKVYRPRALRNLRNDVMYREGREYLGDQGMNHNAKVDGGAIHQGKKREMRAIEKKTGFGASLQHGSWLN